MPAQPCGKLQENKNTREKLQKYMIQQENIT
jgi:hypothetical protein